MKNFWTSFLAALAAFVIGSVILSSLSIFFFFGMIASLASVEKEKHKVPEEAVLRLKIGALNEITTSSPYNFLLEQDKEEPISLTSLLEVIEKAKNNHRIEGIYLDSPAPFAGMASLKAVREALEDFKASGKWVVAYADSYTQRGYYLSSVADKLYLNPEGMVEINGLSTMSLFFRNTLKKIGVEMLIFKVGTYKGAVEPFILDGFSEANKEQIISYMNGIWGEIQISVSKSRSIPADSLNAIVNRGPSTFAPQEYLALKMVDGLKYEREVMDDIRERVGLDKDDKIAFVSPNIVNSTSTPKSSGKDLIAVCYAEGEIKDDEGYGATNVISSSSVKELMKLADDDDIDAVVMRVNSPGGSAFISDQIWDAVRYTKAKKPVVVSMGDYAASGGYYISCASSYIFADPVTITGSIGVFGIFPNYAGLADKISLKHDEIKTHEFAGTLGNPFRPLSDGENSMMQTYVERTYNTFLTRVADGRGLTKEEVDAVGQGRVWTGKQALEHKLVDELGGLDDAIKKAAELAGVENYKVSYASTKKSYFDNIFDFALSGLSYKMMHYILTEEEVAAIQASRDLRSMEGVQVLLPYDIAF